MKIAVWATAIDCPLAGMEVIAKAVCSRLKENHDLRLYAEAPYSAFPKTRANFPIIYLNEKPISKYSLKQISSCFRFREEMQKFQPDVILFVGTLKFFYIRLFLWGKKLRSVPTVVWEHNIFKSQLRKKQLKTFARKTAAKKATRVIVLTERDKNHYLTGAKCLNSPVVIPNFIDTSRISQTQLPLLKRKKQVVFSGRIVLGKQVDKLLNIWQKIESRDSQWHLLLLGRGNLLEAMKNIANEKGLQRAEFLGFQEEPGKFYADSQIMVLTSQEEGFSLVLAEALFYNLPSVSFDCDCGPSSIIDDGKNGFLIPCFDEELFAEKLLQLMNDDELRSQFSINTAEKRKLFTEEAIMQQWEKLLTELI